jgi:hypothetical protein
LSTNISELRNRLRVDLADPAGDRWTDNDLDRHIQHAVRDLNRVAPRELVDTSFTIPDPASRELDVTELPGLIRVITVEYPVGGYPRRLRHFEMWGATLTLFTDTMPEAGAPVSVYYNARHTVDATTSTLPAHLEDLVLLGAAGYALLGYLAATHDRVTIGDGRTSAELRVHANDLLMQFRQDLTALKRERQRVVAAGELWTEDER